MSISNPLKTASFALELNGFDVATAQGVQFPEIEVQKVEHGAGRSTIKTAGGVTVGDAELTQLKRADSASNAAWNWLSEAVTGLPSQYKRDIVFKELSPTGSVINSYLWEGCFVTKVAQTEYEYGSDVSNVIETVTISVDNVTKLI